MSDFCTAVLMKVKLCWCSFSIIQIMVILNALLESKKKKKPVCLEFRQLGYLNQYKVEIEYFTLDERINTHLL